MSLELGGPDVTQNIVPQYQQWQETGAWRRMEDQAKRTTIPQPVFVVLMEYANGGDAMASNLHDTFQNVNASVYWDDYRIPTRFQVWLLSGTAQPGAGILANILGDGLSENARAAATANLTGQLNAVPTFQDFSVTAMPQEDVSYWRHDLLAKTVEGNFADYRINFNAAAPTSPFRESEAEYILGRGEDVREKLKGDHGWLKHDLIQYASDANLLEAVFHQHPLMGGTSRSIKRRQDAYEEALKKFSAEADGTRPKGGGKDSSGKSRAKSFRTGGA
jgi:hypothetical protein